VTPKDLAEAFKDMHNLATQNENVEKLRHMREDRLLQKNVDRIDEDLKKAEEETKTG